MCGRRDTGYSLAEVAHIVAPEMTHPVMSRGVGWERRAVNVRVPTVARLGTALHRRGLADEPWCRLTHAAQTRSAKRMTTELQ